MNNKLFCRTMLRKICLVAAFGISSLALFAQGTKISGTVTDTNGSSLPGVNVTVKGTTQGTVTDENGRYNLPVPSEESTLQFTFVGYTTQEIVVGNRQIIDVQMSEGVELEEVMVVAYGTTTKASFTGSASVVKSDQLQKISAVNAMESMQGMTAGVIITNNEGSPGRASRIQIRGIGTFRDDATATTPLYVVDGVPYDGSINSIAPTDIESMTVLKDAAASALYGPRAANGVVVITTRKGKTGKPTVNFRAAWGTSDNAVKNPKKADPYQTMLYLWRTNFNDGVYRFGYDKDKAAKYATDMGISQSVTQRQNSKGESVFVSPFKSMPTDQYVFYDSNYDPYVNPALEMVWEPKDYDFYGAFFKRKLRQDYSFDVSGASANGKTNYYFSGGHLNDMGYGLSQYYKRYSFRANATSQINDWLTMGGNLSYTYARQAGNGSNRMLVFSNSLNSPWLRNVDNTDWEYSLETGHRMKDYGTNVAEFFGIHSLDGMGGQGDYWNNPDDYNFNNDEHTLMTAHYFAEIKLPFDIKYKMNINYDDVNQTHYGYGSAVHGGDQLAPYGVTVKTNGGDASRSTTKTTSLTWNNLLTWDKTFGKNTINVLAGHEFYQRNVNYEYAYGAGIMELHRYELRNTTRDWSADSYRDRYALLSFFGQLQYNYDNKYYLSASVRTDGSSRFSPKARWGEFFSVGGSWRISQESFMQNISWLQNLSLRASYGSTGNDNIGSLYAYQAYYGSYNLYDEAGLRKTTNAAEDLHWEENQQFNVAVDFSIFKRVSGSIEYYHRQSAGLLATRDLPYSYAAGANQVNTNLGDILNSGFEFSAQVNVMRTNDFTWDINANYTTLHNEVLKLPGGPQMWSSYSNFKREVGSAVWNHFMVKNDGVNPENGRLIYWVNDGNGNWSTTEDNTKVDISRDGQYVGTSTPKGFGSITNSFKYKDFDFSFMFYGSHGSRLYSAQLRENQRVRAGVSVVPSIVDGHVWQKPGDNADFARWSFDAASTGSTTGMACDEWLINNSFLRLRNVTLGYSLPKTFLNKIGVSNVRVYVTGDNLLTFSPITKYFIDPETGLRGSDYNGNGDNDSGIQGARRVYMGGIQVTF